VSGPLVVHLIDDDETLRDSVQGFLVGEGLEVVSYASADGFLAAVDSLAAGCVVTDMRMPGMSGMELLTEIGRLGLALPVIVITGHADVALAVQAMKNGAVDLLEKPFRGDDLIEAIRRALALDRAAQVVAATPKTRGRLAMLTAREAEVLDRLVRGQSNKIIAHEMGISPRTVEVHRANLMRKTEARSFSELIRMFLDDARS
jgi:two-component system response regulator FixJ